MGEGEGEDADRLGQVGRAAPTGPSEKAPLRLWEAQILTGALAGCRARETARRPGLFGSRVVGLPSTGGAVQAGGSAPAPLPGASRKPVLTSYEPGSRDSLCETSRPHQASVCGSSRHTTPDPHGFVSARGGSARGCTGCVPSTHMVNPHPACDGI